MGEHLDGRSESVDGRFPPAKEPLLELLRHWAARRPQAIAVRDRSVSLTWSMLDRSVRRGALRLRDQGIRPGDRVLLHCDRSAYFAVAYFAVHAAGGVCVIAASDVPSMAIDAAASSQAKLTLILEGASAIGPSMSVERLCGAGPEQDRLPEIGLDDIADILYTTGSTGAPKGVVLTHANIANAALNTSWLLRQEESDVEVCALPLTHSFGLGRLRCLAHAGNSLILEPGMRGIGETLKAAQASGATGLSMTPAGLALLRRVRADAEIQELGKKLRYIELLGAPIAAEVRDWAVERLGGARLRHHYGMTEASRAVGVDLASEDARRGSIGRPAPNVTVEVRDPAGALVAPGEKGELWIRGAVVAREYWRQPALTSEVFVDGAVKSGDLGRMDGDGAIFLHDRLSELINVGGIKVAPQEVESVISLHPDVIEVACKGVADPLGISGERVAAFIVSSRAIELAEINAWLRERGLDGHRMPVRVERVASLPRSPSGKLLRRQLTSDPGA